MIDLSKNQRSINTSGAHVDGGDVDALRARFEKLLSDSGRACLYEGDGQYAYPHDFSWLCYQTGYAAAKVETADLVAQEREHCALVCEDVRRAVAEVNGAGVAAAQQCADAIRAGAKEPNDG